MGKYGEPWVARGFRVWESAHAHKDRRGKIADVALSWHSSAEARDLTERVVAVGNFCAGHTIPEDGPALADVLDALGKLREAISMGPLDIAAKYGPDGPSPDELVIGAVGYVDFILAALPKATPTEEPGE